MTSFSSELGMAYQLEIVEIATKAKTMEEPKPEILTMFTLSEIVGFVDFFKSKHFVIPKPTFAIRNIPSYLVSFFRRT